MSKEPPLVKRTKLTAFYLAEDDYELLRRMARAGGFKSMSHMMTALVEPILRGGFSLVSFIRSANRLQKFMERHGVKFTVSWSSLVEFTLFPSPPPAIPEEPLDLDQVTDDLANVVAALAEDQGLDLPFESSTTKENKEKKL